MKHRDAYIAFLLILSAGIGYWFLLRQFNIERLVNRGAQTRVTPDNTPYFIELAGEKFGDADVKLLRPAKTLEQVVLRESSVTDAGMVFLKSLPKLKSVDVGKTRITDAGLLHLSQIPTLKTLSLDGTAITDQGLEPFVNHQLIRELQLSACEHITVQGVRTLLKNPKISTIHIQATQIGYNDFRQLIELYPEVSFVVDDASILGLQNSQHLSGTLSPDKKLIFMRIKLLNSSQDSATSRDVLTQLDDFEGKEHVRSVNIEMESGPGQAELAIEILKHFPHLTSLNYLGEINNALLDEVGRHLSLESLSLRTFKNVEHPIDNHEQEQLRLSPLATLIHLNHLILEMNAVDPESFHSLRQLKNLTSLSLSRPHLRDENIEFMRDLDQLSHLYLYGHSLTSASLEIFRDLPLLLYADLRDNAIDEQQLAEFQNELQLRRENFRIPYPSP